MKLRGDRLGTAEARAARPRRAAPCARRRRAPPARRAPAGARRRAARRRGRCGRANRRRGDAAARERVDVRDQRKERRRRSPTMSWNARTIVVPDASAAPRRRGRRGLWSRRWPRGRATTPLAGAVGQLLCREPRVVRSAVRRPRLAGGRARVAEAEARPRRWRQRSTSSTPWRRGSGRAAWERTLRARAPPLGPRGPDARASAASARRRRRPGGSKRPTRAPNGLRDR